MVEISLAGPRKNALSTAMLEHVLGSLAAANGGPVLLRGGGGCFSAGVDLLELMASDAAGIERYVRLLDRTCAALFHHPGPVVALVEGHAIAGGAVLVLCSDFAVSIDDGAARLGLTEVAIGVRFPPRMLRIVRSRLDPRHREAVILGSGLHAPREALALGLVQAVVPDAEDVARARLAALAALPPPAYAAMKADLRDEVTRIAAADEARVFAEALSTWTSEDLQHTIRRKLGK